MSSTSWVEAFRRGELRALSRLISLAENQDASVPTVMEQLYVPSGKAKIVGITGAPGAGKSTLTSGFVKFLREAKQRVAVLAVDPVSPFTGGALLGDRIRLLDHFNDEGVFIRSLSTRGKLGGLSLAMRQVVHLCDAFGFDFILLETVGVGQSEVDVRKLADLSVVVLVPEWGDGIQAIKAGILEIGDLFVVNKADREGADRVVNELKNMLQMAGKLQVPVVSSCGLKEETVRSVFGEIEAFLSRETALIRARRAARAEEAVGELLSDLVAREARAWVSGQKVDASNPYRFLLEFQRKHPAGSLFR